MKAFLGFALIFCSGWAHARVLSAYGSGYANGWCDGNSSFFCFDNIKQQARRDAVSRADLDCRIRNGKTQGSYTASCGMEFCNPSYLPTNAPSQMISCRSDCSINCEVED